MRRAAARTLGLLVVAGVIAVPPGCSSGPARSFVVQGSLSLGSPGGWFEPSVAVDRVSARLVAVAAMEAPRPAGVVRVFVSADGGVSFADRGRPFEVVDGEPVSASGDASVVVGDDGAVVVAALLVVGERSLVAVARSVDEGVSWVVAVVDRSDTPVRTSGPRAPAARLDKPWLSLASDGTFGLVWSHETARRWELWSSTSTDGGVVFGPPRVVERDRPEPQFASWAPSASGGLGQVVWTRDAAVVVAGAPAREARSLSRERSAGSVGPVSVDGRAGRSACWAESGEGKVGAWCSSDAGPGRRAATGEGLPAVVAVGDDDVLVTLRPVGGTLRLLARLGARGSWSQPTELASFAAPSDVCLAGCEEREGGRDIAPAVGDYHGVDRLGDRGFVVATVEPGPAIGASALRVLRVDLASA